MARPRVLVIKADGTNCELETSFGVEAAGGAADIVPVNLLRSGERRLSAYDALVIPGGFSYGDDVTSGKILAVELLTFLGDELTEFVAAGKPVMGICNGFQVLVRTGLLPFRDPGHAAATLAENDSGRYECRWVRMRTQGMSDLAAALPEIMELPVAHGEGRFFAPAHVLDRVESEQLVALRYIDDGGAPTQTHPANPNGSSRAIAAISDASGRVFGLMPHPERYLRAYQHPSRRNGSAGAADADGLVLLRAFVSLA
jgi:phosphoribosylformylglycinamidine synthase